MNPKRAAGKACARGSRNGTVSKIQDAPQGAQIPSTSAADSHPDFTPSTPTDLASRTDLTQTAKLLYGRLRRRSLIAASRGQASFRASQAVLGREVGRSLRTASRALGELVEAGLLTVIRTGWKCRYVLPMYRPAVLHGSVATEPESRYAIRGASDTPKAAHRYRAVAVGDTGACTGPDASGPCPQSHEEQTATANSHESLANSRIPMPAAGTPSYRRALELGHEALNSPGGPRLGQVLAGAGYVWSDPRRPDRERRNREAVAVCLGAIVTAAADWSTELCHVLVCAVANVDEGNVCRILAGIVEEIAGRRSRNPGLADKGRLVASIVRKGPWA